MNLLAIVLVSRPVAADQISGLRAEATEISQKLIEEQLQIGAYQQQYSVTSEKLAVDQGDMARIGRQIGQDEEQMTNDLRAVRQQAVLTYMDAGSQLSASDDALFSGDMETVQLATEYSSIATGNVETALDQLHIAQRAMQVREAALQQEEAQDQLEQTQQATDLAQATHTENQMQLLQSEVTGQLAAAVAQQAAVQAAAAAAAVAAAQRAAAQRAAAQTTTTEDPAAPPSLTSTTTLPGPGTDPALNAYLQCVVEAESGGNYGAVSPNGLYMGAFQFSQATWNTAAQAAGLPDLVGVAPNLASKADQDAVAVALYALDGQQPWLGDRCSS